MSLYHHFKPGIEPPERLEGPAIWFAFKHGQLWLQRSAGEYSIVQAQNLEELCVPAVRQQYLGELKGCHCFSIQLHDDFAAPSGSELVGLRQTHGRLPDEQFAIAGFAYQIVEWDRTHQYCGTCGTQTETLPQERARVCPECKLTNYPRLSPAVIVSVRRSDQLLLSRSYNLPEKMYSVLAGFVEPGETLEEAVAREVHEEVGIRIRNIKYFGSQPWPFPNSLMIGFTADHADGELQINRSEIDDAGWYSIDTLPQIPPKLSIARSLIDAFIRDQRKTNHKNE